MVKSSGKGSGGRNTTSQPNPKQIPKENSAQRQQAKFKEELASRIESAHKETQYNRALHREDIEITLGVGDYDLYFKEFCKYFKNTRIDPMTKEEKEEANQSKIKVREISKLRWRKPRRRSRGKIKKVNKKNES